MRDASHREVSLGLYDKIKVSPSNAEAYIPREQHAKDPSGAARILRIARALAPDSPEVVEALAAGAFFLLIFPTCIRAFFLFSLHIPSIYSFFHF